MSKETDIDELILSELRKSWDREEQYMAIVSEQYCKSQRDLTEVQQRILFEMEDRKDKLNKQIKRLEGRIPDQFILRREYQAKLNILKELIKFVKKGWR